MNQDTVWLALALVLVFEGLFPFASPAAWRRMFSQLLELRDGQIRFFAAVCISCGLLLIWLVSG